MARRSNVCPSYLLHQPTGQARVRINGKDYYLGEYGSEESRVRYGEIIAKYASGQALEPFSAARKATGCSAECGLTTNELVLAFMRHAAGHYVKNGKPTSEIHCLKSAARPLIELFGFTPVDAFGPLMLKSVREKMVATGWCRSVINKNVGRLRSIFRWGVENEMVSAVTLQRLQAVSPLLSGRTKAQDKPARTPATEEQVEAVRKHVSPLVRDLIDVQRLTGARAGELLLITPARIDRSNDVWLYYVDGHKTEHHGHRRIIAIGSRAQVILNRRMQSLGTNDRVFKIRRDSYTLAVRRACQEHDIPPWTPHQLRHAAGQEIRTKFGLEHVQAALGHAEFAMSEVYAKATLERAVEVAAAVG